MKNFTYQVIAHGKIVYAENVDVPDRKYHVVMFNATFALAPKATFLVYYFNKGDIIATRTEIAIEDDLENFVKVKLSKTETQPGKQILIDVITNPKSFINLLGVDQSVLLLKENKGITTKQALDSINDFDNKFHNIESGPWTVQPRNYIESYFRQFDYSDVILFTNAKQNRNFNKIICTFCGVYFNY